MIVSDAALQTPKNKPESSDPRSLSHPLIQEVSLTHFHAKFDQKLTVTKRRHIRSSDR